MKLFCIFCNNKIVIFFLGFNASYPTIVKFLAAGATLQLFRKGQIGSYSPMQIFNSVSITRTTEF